MRLGDRKYDPRFQTTSGRVEIYMDGEWGTIRYDTSNKSDGQRGVGEAICIQLELGDVFRVGPVMQIK